MTKRILHLLMALFLLASAANAKARSSAPRASSNGGYGSVASLPSMPAGPSYSPVSQGSTGSSGQSSSGPASSALSPMSTAQVQNMVDRQNGPSTTGLAQGITQGQDPTSYNAAINALMAQANALVAQAYKMLAEETALANKAEYYSSQESTCGSPGPSNPGWASCINNWESLAQNELNKMEAMQSQWQAWEAWGMSLASQAQALAASVNSSQGGLPSASPAGQDISDLAARLGVAVGSFADRGGPGYTTSDDIGILRSLGYNIGALDVMGTDEGFGSFNFGLSDYRRWSGNPEWYDDMDSVDKRMAQYQALQSQAAGQEQEAQRRQGLADNGKGADADYQQGVAKALQSDLDSKTIPLLRSAADESLNGSLAIKPVPALEPAADPSTLSAADGLGDKANALLAGLKDDATAAGQWALNKAEDTAVGKATAAVIDAAKAGADALAGEGTGENLEKVMDAQGAVRDSSMGILSMTSSKIVPALASGSDNSAELQSYSDQIDGTNTKTFKKVWDIITK
jgi:hypothetical protein